MKLNGSKTIISKLNLCYTNSSAISCHFNKKLCIKIAFNSSYKYDSKREYIEIALYKNLTFHLIQESHLMFYYAVHESLTGFCHARKSAYNI